ncbi:MAG: hypothetical protein HY245_05045 [Rhizobiales bacterium]|nr:hypothetical protein [Hyphomicrobiales bacterium]MBI3672780.1 hypothetical protein [Hyphomicrobiales bacterium]
MKAAIARLTRLEASYDRLLAAIERDIAWWLARRNHLSTERAAIAEVLECGGPFHDLALPAAIRRMAGLDREAAEVERTLVELRLRAISCALKSKRAASLAAGLRRQAKALAARDDLAELTGRIAVAQACGK